MSTELWRAVIQQAITDAARPLATKHLAERAEQLRSRDWLTKPNRDFKEVCDLAGLDATRVRKYARALIEEASKHDMPIAPTRQRKPSHEHDDRTAA